jgi:hypothetical protein
MVVERLAPAYCFCQSASLLLAAIAAPSPLSPAQMVSSTGSVYPVQSKDSTWR